MRTIERRIEALERKRVESAFPSIAEMGEAQIAEMGEAQLVAAMARMGDMKEYELLWLLGGEPGAEELAHALA